jgi:sulfatase maturation enzyme AslB (radical SAM superfamily)
MKMNLIFLEAKKKCNSILLNFNKTVKKSKCINNITNNKFKLNSNNYVNLAKDNSKIYYYQSKHFTNNNNNIKDNKLKDSFHRIHDYLRISLTEKCNLRCTYCMPEQGIELTPNEKLLSRDDLSKLLKIFINLGITKVR